MYLFDERIGPKNTDHTVSFLTHYWRTISQQHPWIHRLAIFLDNATSTNQNKYLFSWAREMVSCGELEHIHISFMIAGHTKFAPDQLFSTIGCAYKTEDVFTINDLKSICESVQHASLKQEKQYLPGETLLERSILTSQVYASTTTFLLSRHVWNSGHESLCKLLWWKLEELSSPFT